MSKYEDTRIVTFKEDYSVPKVDKNGDVIKDQRIIYYKKNSKHAIHYKVVDKLESKGAKMDVELFDHKGWVKEQKKLRLQSDKHKISVERRK